jgi:hypothetical protein
MVLYWQSCGASRVDMVRFLFLLIFRDKDTLLKKISTTFKWNTQFADNVAGMRLYQNLLSHAHDKMSTDLIRKCKPSEIEWEESQLY